MKKKKHKFHVGQLIRLRNSAYVSEKMRKKYGYIAGLVDTIFMHGQLEYKVIIQGEPQKTYYTFEREIEIVK